MRSPRIIIVILISIIPYIALISCSNGTEKRIEIAKIIESRSTQDLLNDLYLASDGDIETLARMLQTTPSSIDRLRKGKTDPTPLFEEKVKSTATYYYQNGRKFSKLKSALDNEYKWYDSILNFRSHHPYWFWSIVIIGIIPSILLLIILIFTLINWPGFLLLLLGLVISLISLIIWLSSLFHSIAPMEDKYIDSINPVVEQVLK